MIHGTVVSIINSNGEFKTSVYSNKKMFFSFTDMHPAVKVGQRVYIRGDRNYEIVRVL